MNTQADALLERIQHEVPNGKQAALELLLHLTRINDEGRHTRQRITREEAVFVGEDRKKTLWALVNRLVFWVLRKKSTDTKGERVVQLLSGERRQDLPGEAHNGTLRLITASTDHDKQYLDLIHETLIRARFKDEKTGKRIHRPRTKRLWRRCGPPVVMAV